ncbi:ATP-dependent RNA helicase HrpA [Neiella marina]|uniref:ATP-dependent RNA helicase HrpA n=1 Tax=Neiella holothuriorum TaxID=2870530 RepID=A0ABS7EHS7_9GAMM|nr:ATP-dependent RNA helicase HrpA [Neiella holothuriorum]MBW8191901.1 ATP-dependent RNA helicase HrpA [Neiella holothuriorum]
MANSGHILNQQLALCMLADQGKLRGRWHGLKKIRDEQKREQVSQKIQQSIEASQSRRQARANNLPTVSYPEQLPVSQKRDEIAQAIVDHQVVIVAGETGSGKTTQLPKICLELGRGIGGLIGHTQPRRLAARSVASRIADEMDSKIGEHVGFKVRFSDHTSPNSYIKLMTDGILLNEIQQDRLLRQYDTIIIDEAHERSLNIDFILGYLRELLPKRPDLKVVITSATIDPERFSKHFDGAPIIEVSGRTYPVEMRYRPLAEDDQSQDLHDAIVAAVDELSAEGPGDILIFMNGEREIRDLADTLSKQNYRSTEILPLYARLAASEQQRVFKPAAGRRLVISTNVAETSLTVPGIRYVVDPGTARISRYSVRSKVQRLPIEAISQASANQRSGRCGRVAEGICIRLYSEEDFNARPEFTEPEILRTNLASVILQMAMLNFGDIEAFPFVEKPDTKTVRDGIRLLEEIGAAQFSGRGSVTLTALGNKLARFPVDPRLSRMLLHGAEHGAGKELAVICAALGTQDVRERPLEKRSQSDQCHAQWNDKSSDFMAMLNLWQGIEAQQQELSNSQFRKWCRSQFINYLRVREWQDVYQQLTSHLAELDIKLNEEGANYAQIHQSILSGMLSHVGQLNKDRDYQGARNRVFTMFPGSSLGRKRPKWLVAAELVETSKLFARYVADIDVSWLEPLSQHLVKRSYSEPVFEEKRQDVVASEKQTLFGLTIVPARKVSFGRIDPVAARNLFIKEALVAGKLRLNAPFFQKNQQLVNEIHQQEAKIRRRDLLIHDDEHAELYAERLPTQIYNKVGLAQWLKLESKANNKTLMLTREQLLARNEDDLNDSQYPQQWQFGNVSLRMDYQFEPGQEHDGVIVRVPLSLLNQVEERSFDWHIPAMREELITAMIKSLPKQLRKQFVPAPDYARKVINEIDEQEDFVGEVTRALRKFSGQRLDESIWEQNDVPDHLRMKFQVVDDKGQQVAIGTDLTKLREQLQERIQASLKKVEAEQVKQSSSEQWCFGALPEMQSIRRDGYQVELHPSLVDEGKEVSLQQFDELAQAISQHHAGVRRLVLLSIPSPRSYLVKNLPNKAKLAMYYNPLGQVNDLVGDLVDAAADALIDDSWAVRDESSFNALREHVRAELNETAGTIALQVEQILTIAHKLNKGLKGRMPFELVNSYQDIQQCLNDLVFKGFVSANGVAKLDDVERYMKALLRRFEKLAENPTKDRQSILLVEKLTGRYQKLAEKSAVKRKAAAELESVKWQIEELKVSIHAQQLGTSGPVSEKRVSAALAELEKVR